MHHCKIAILSLTHGITSLIYCTDNRTISKFERELFFKHSSSFRIPRSTAPPKTSEALKSALLLWIMHLYYLVEVNIFGARVRKLTAYGEVAN